MMDAVSHWFSPCARLNAGLSLLAAADALARKAPWWTPVLCVILTGCFQLAAAYIKRPGEARPPKPRKAGKR